jgi:hypothetical protein
MPAIVPYRGAPLDVTVAGLINSFQGVALDKLGWHHPAGF